jgi:hypothetical protein
LSAALTFPAQRFGWLIQGVEIIKFWQFHLSVCEVGGGRRRLGVNDQGKAGTKRRRISFGAMFCLCSHTMLCLKGVWQQASKQAVPQSGGRR